MPCIAAAIDFRQKEKRNGLQTKRSIDTSSVSRSFSTLIITHQLLIFRCRSLSNVWQRKQVADGMTSTIPSVITPATGNKQRNRRFSFGGADFIYYKPSEQSTFFTAYPECNGYNYFKVVNVITDTIRLPDISHRIGFIQFIVLIDYPYRLADIAREHPEQVGNLKLHHPYGCGRHSDCTHFTDCYYASAHNSFIL